MKNWTKKVIRIAVLVMLFMGVSQMSYAQKGESALGLKAGYVSKNSSISTAFFYHYGLTEDLRLAPEVGCVFRHQDKDAITADLNLHYILRLNSGSNVQLYPLAGFNFTSWNLMKVVSDNGAGDVSTRANRFGVNLGAGYQMNVSESLKLNVEAKYTLTSKYSSFALSVGLGYVF